MVRRGDHRREGAVSTRSVITAFSAEHVSQITGLSVRQLTYWDDLGFFKPSLRQNDEGGKPLRVYSFTDVVGLRVIAVLRNEHRVSLSRLQKAAAKLEAYSKTPWASLKITVSKGEVGFVEPSSGRGRGVISGQYIMMPLVDQIRYVERAAADLSERKEDQIGTAERHRNVVHNVSVFAGTRVPVRAVERFLSAGFSPQQVLREYPSLKLADIEMVQSELHHRTAA